MDELNKVTLFWEDCRHRADSIASALMVLYPKSACSIYGVPKGGIHAATLVQGALHQRGYYAELVEDYEQAHCVVDDIIDTGRTRQRFHGPFYALVDKLGLDKHWKGKWISFPWERQNGDSGIEENIVRILEWIGEDPKREGLRETPARVARAYQEFFSGYKQNPEDLVKVFDGEIYDEMVLLKGCEFTSFCEHHMLPFSGIAHIAYIPEGSKIIGLSKLARLLDIYSKRFQVQERLTSQVTQALDKLLSPKGSACVIEATHSCLSCRGARKQNATMVTSSLTGAFRRPEVRAEFFHLIH